MKDIGFCALLLCGFVGSIYLWPKERQFALMCVKNLQKASSLDEPYYVSRNSPLTIKRRLLSILGASGVSILILENLLCKNVEERQFLLGSRALHYIISPQGTLIESVMFALATGVATVVLFTGPICESVETFSNFSADRLIFFRNFIVSPFAEEIFFRGLLLYVLRTRSKASAIAISSAFFAISHSHHIFTFVAEEYQIAETLGEPYKSTLIFWKRATQRLFFVFAITFAYGLLSGYYFIDVCAQNILATTLSHFICNLLGAPPFKFLRNGRPIERIKNTVTHIGGIIGWALIASKLRRMVKEKEFVNSCGP